MSSRSALALDGSLVRKGMHLSVLEGVAFALMVGLSEVYFVADAIRLGASTTSVGLVVTAPLFVGALGALLSLPLLARARTRKPLVVAAACMQGLVLLGLACMHQAGLSTPVTLVACAGAYGFFGQLGSAAWSSWYGDLVPQAERGRYFSHRNRFLYGGTFAGLLIGGFCLNRLEPTAPGAPAAALASATAGHGFALIYAIAGVCRLASTALHVRAPEPRFHGIAPLRRVTLFLFTRTGAETRRFLLSCSAFYLSVYLASPYFGPYMLADLHFSYAEYTFVSGWIVGAKILSLPLWGRTIDQIGARAVYTTAAVGAALVPLPFLWAKGLVWVLVAQGVSGISWAGFELSLFSLLLDRTRRRIRPHLFALQSALNGSVQLIGGVLGAALIGVFGGDVRVIFAISLALRLATTVMLPRALPRPLDEPGRGAVLLRVIGIRPSGGVAVRPLNGAGPARVEREES